MANQPISNKQYNLFSVIYHAAQGSKTMRKYLLDAQQSAEHEMTQFFADACRHYEQVAQRGLQLLKARVE